MKYYVGSMWRDPITMELIRERSLKKPFLEAKQEVDAWGVVDPTNDHFRWVEDKDGTIIYPRSPGPDYMPFE